MKKREASKIANPVLVVADHVVREGERPQWLGFRQKQSESARPRAWEIGRRYQYLQEMGAQITGSALAEVS